MTGTSPAAVAYTAGKRGTVARDTGVAAEVREVLRGYDGMLPARVEDPADVLPRLDADGICVLSRSLVAQSEICSTGAAALGARLRTAWRVNIVRPQTAPGKLRHKDSATNTVWEPTQEDTGDGRVWVRSAGPHTEGWTLDNICPDVVMHACERPGDPGGRAYVVDGYELLERLRRTPWGRRLRRDLASVPVCLWVHAKQPHSSTPLVDHTRAGRTRVSYVPMRVVPLHDAAGEPDPGTRVAARWAELVESAARLTRRFAIQRGDVVLFDNYRHFFGRDAYSGDRLMHLGYFWTDRAFGHPARPLKAAPAAPAERGQ